MSSTVAVIAWPRCNAPVTLGGGILITNVLPVVPARGLKYPPSSQKRYHLPSTACGSYVFGKDAIACVSGSLSCSIMSSSNQKALLAAKDEKGRWLLVVPPCFDQSFKDRSSNSALTGAPCFQTPRQPSVRPIRGRLTAYRSSLSRGVRTYSSCSSSRVQLYYI